MKIVKKVQMKIIIFTSIVNRCILHGCVFVNLLSLSSTGIHLDILKFAVKGD